MVAPAAHEGENNITGVMMLLPHFALLFLRDKAGTEIEL